MERMQLRHQLNIYTTPNHSIATFINLSRFNRAIASWWSSLEINSGVKPFTAKVVLIREDFLHQKQI